MGGEAHHGLIIGTASPAALPGIFQGSPDMTELATEGEMIAVMKRCSEEIKLLRAQIARLEPKAAAYDDLSRVLSLIPRASQGAGEDLALRLDQRVKELTSRAPAQLGAQPGTTQPT